jgi:hypothetical protein
MKAAAFPFFHRISLTSALQRRHNSSRRVERNGSIYPIPDNRALPEFRFRRKRRLAIDEARFAGQMRYFFGRKKKLDYPLRIYTIAPCSDGLCFRLAVGEIFLLVLLCIHG